MRHCSVCRWGVMIIALASAVVAAGGASPSRRLVPAVLRSGVVINIPQRMLFLMSEGSTVASYPVGLGRPDWPTFIGAFTITAKEVDPVWDVPISIQEQQRRAGERVLTRVPPGPLNPLGKYWLGLSVAGYGIHGTNAPRSISTFQSHGCVRMLAPDIEDLFARVEVGTAGLSIYEPIVVGLVDGQVWMETHADVYRLDRRDAVGYVVIEATRLAPRAVLDHQTIDRLLQDRDGHAERIDREVP